MAPATTSVAAEVQGTNMPAAAPASCSAPPGTTSSASIHATSVMVNEGGLAVKVRCVADRQAVRAGPWPRTCGRVLSPSAPTCGVTDQPTNSTGLHNNPPPPRSPLPARAEGEHPPVYSQQLDSTGRGQEPRRACGRRQGAAFRRQAGSGAGPPQVNLYCRCRKLYRQPWPVAQQPAFLHYCSHATVGLTAYER